jgi:hypothetical protein
MSTAFPGLGLQEDLGLGWCGALSTNRPGWRPHCHVQATSPIATPLHILFITHTALCH